LRHNPHWLILEVNIKNIGNIMLTKRHIALAAAAALAAVPLIWLNLDPNAGDKLLRWFSKASAKAATK
jgi:hypothetical protein